MSPSIRPEALDSPVAQELITALNAELSGRYPEAGPEHFHLDPQEVAPGRGTFLVVREGERPIACGAIRRLASGAAEIKRMFVVPDRRGQGVGRLLVEALEEAARALGVGRLVLETGVRQPDAIALYRKCGFTIIPAFDGNEAYELSVFMGKDLAT